MCKLELIVDMGTATTVIIERKRGLLMSQPSLVAVLQKEGKPKLVAVGDEALALRKKKPQDVMFVYPIVGGVVANREAASLMIKGFLTQITQKMLIRPQLDVMQIVSCGLHTTDRRAWEEVYYQLGIKSVTLIEAPIAAASHVVGGADFVVIVGAGITDIAIVGESGIMAGCSIDIAASKMDDAIISYVYNKYNASITRARAADLRAKRGTLSERDVSATEVNAKDVLDGRMKKIEVTGEDLRLAITPLVNTLCDAIWAMFRLCPEQMVESVKHGGVKLYGGVAGLHYLDSYLSDKLKLSVEVHSSPEALAESAALFFNDKDKLYKMLGLGKEVDR